MFYPFQPYEPPPKYEGPVMATEFGWRYWSWNPKTKVLCSPMYRAIWRDGELTALNWFSREQKSEYRNVAGIHAVKAPVEWWTAKDSEITQCGEVITAFATCIDEEVGDVAAWSSGEISVTGLVERFGRYVLGERGWRAEYVVIRELLAPNTEIGLQLEQAFPDILVRYVEGS